MEDVTMNNSSVTMNNSSDLNITVTPEFIYPTRIYSVSSIVTFIVICIGLPLILLAICSVYSMVRSDHAAPVYVINLLISDLFQLILLIMIEAQPYYWLSYIIYAHHTAVLASIGFMVFLALERYMLIAHPLWYRFNQSTKMSVVICVVVWVCSIVVASLSFDTTVIAFLLPMPLFIFLLIGTIRALSSSVSVPFNEKCRIVIILALVFGIYTLLFLPTALLHLTIDVYIIELAIILLRLSPLADLILYVFIRKGTAEKLLSFLRCSRREQNNTIPTVSGRDGSPS